jgi:Domain of unknown function (DUF4291)
MRSGKIQTVHIHTVRSRFKMTQENFRLLILSNAVVVVSSETASSMSLTPTESTMPVVAQWDPERSSSLALLPYWSIQIRIKREVSRKWAAEWVEGIEGLRRVRDGERVGRGAQGGVWVLGRSRGPVIPDVNRAKLKLRELSKTIILTRISSTV